jgi:hypothetical protein
MARRGKRTRVGVVALRLDRGQLTAVLLALLRTRVELAPSTRADLVDARELVARALVRATKVDVRRPR